MHVDSSIERRQRSTKRHLRDSLSGNDLTRILEQQCQHIEFGGGQCYRLAMFGDGSCSTLQLDITHDYRPRRLTLAICALTATQMAQAHSSDMDLTASVSALFPNDADHNGTSRSASHSAGWLLTYRYWFLPWGGIEANYGHSTDVQHIQDSIGPAVIHTEVHEVTAALVFRYPTSGTITPFALVGMGLLQFSPISGDNNLSPQSQNKTNAVYGIGVDYAFAPRWRLRAQYRGLLGQAPSFIVPRFRTETYLHIAEPTIGLSYAF